MASPKTPVPPGFLFVRPVHGGLNEVDLPEEGADLPIEEAQALIARGLVTEAAAEPTTEGDAQ